MIRLVTFVVAAFNKDGELIQPSSVEGFNPEHVVSVKPRVTRSVNGLPDQSVTELYLVDGRMVVVDEITRNVVRLLEGAGA